MDIEAIRAHLAHVLDWHEAHVTFDKAVEGIPEAARGALAPGFEHSPWQLIEHLRLAQHDLLDFCVNTAYAHTLTWPDDYWPRQPAPPAGAAWRDSIAAFHADRKRLKALALDPAIDLGARVPTGNERQTYLRSILLVVDHNAYHLGQLIAVRKALGIWP